MNKRTDINAFLFEIDNEMDVMQAHILKLQQQLNANTNSTTATTLSPTTTIVTASAPPATENPVSQVTATDTQTTLAST